MKKVKVTFIPSGVEVWVPAGETLREALLYAGLSLETPCAGWGVCGKCKVKIAPIQQNLEVTSQELKHLTMDEIQQGYRLACQANLMQDSEVYLSPAFLDILKKTINISRPTVGSAFPLSPVVSKVYLELPEPTLEDRLADWERLERGLVEHHCLPRPEHGDHGLHLDGELLRTLPSILREADYRITVVLYDNKLIAVEQGNTADRLYGIALDLGTTTMAGTLLDLRSGEQLAVVSRANPHQMVGADVISRISFVSQGEKHLLEMQQQIVAAVNQIIEELLIISGVNRELVYEITVVGNTVIHHLFLGLDPTFLGQGPYVPVVTRPLVIKAHRLGIKIHNSGYLYLLPNIAGFVGGDAVGVILSTGLYQSSQVRLAVDIGTNGEIILGSAEEILACSTAAGPAFEGTRIKHGMRAAAGAIERVVIDRDVELMVIGDVPPRGISGSGLIDAAAEMLRLGIMDHTGRLLSFDELPLSLPVELRRRVIGENSRREFVLAWPDETAHKQLLTISQEDIRELQLAKGALSAGISVLKQELGIKAEQIAEVYLAGAFGSGINPASARMIGLIPDLPLERIVAVGNAAGAGAQLALLSQTARKQAEGIAREVRYIELSGRENFQEAFLGAMYFPRLNPPTG